jgi:hypothetical protein
MVDDLYGSPEHQLFRRTVRKFVQDQPVPRAREFDRMGRIDKSLNRTMGELGMLGLRYDPKWGGAGKSRVAPGSRPPGAPTDPHVRDSRIRLFRSWVRCTTIAGVDGEGGGERVAFLEPEKLRPGHGRPSASAT